MSRLDIVIFGATGFTGRKAVEEIIRISKNNPLTWGVAGRSKEKLDQLLLQVGNITGDDLSRIEVLVADVKDAHSLVSMAQRATVVANFCGPYRFYGEPVVKACIDAGAHYVDVSGEPQFMETQQLKYDKLARDRGVYVISACGFDSVPNDMGVVFLQQHFQGTLNSVESYLTVNVPTKYRKEVFAQGTINYGTWDSAVNSIGNWRDLKELRKKLYPDPLPPFKPKLNSRGVIHRRGSSYSVPFPGADGSVVYRSQRSLHEGYNQRPIHFRPYLQLDGLLYTITLLFIGAIVYCMSQFGMTRGLLLKYPRLFSLGMVSKAGPLPLVTENTTFTFELIGEGWPVGADLATMPPEKRIVAQIKGVNPGYGATVTAILFCAIAIIREKNQLPEHGGVLTTAVAFKDTSLIKNLNENNLTFKIIE